MDLPTKKRSKKRNTPARSSQPRGTQVVFPLIGIGASAGGLEAIQKLLSRVSANSKFSFVIIMHLDPQLKSHADEILGRSSLLPVQAAEEGMRAETGHVYVIPSNTNLSFSKGVFHLLPRKKTKAPHMPIDFFFESLARDQKEKAIGIVLSGTACDGTLGLKAIKAAGGITMAQDPSTAKYDGMPASAIASGVVDWVLPVEKMVEELSDLVNSLKPPSKENLNSDEALKKIFLLLRTHAHVDVSSYKSTTIKRRIQRRMAALKIEELSEYVQYLKTNLEEITALAADIFIHVTEFFRDPESFQELKDNVYSELIKERTLDLPIRIWVPGCSTGEEAYSIAISLLEFLEDHQNRASIQIFGTDISEQAIQKARAGVFSETQLRNVSKEQLDRFFDKVKEGYRIKKIVRELCIFSRHDVINNPPFAKLDLVSFRNVLIYFAPDLQKHVIPVLHYALNSGGFLFLGRSEAPSGFSRIFTHIGNTNKIYKKINATAPVNFRFSAINAGYEKSEANRKINGHSTNGLDIQKDIDRIVMSKYTPASVVVNNLLEILQVRGQTGLYLELPQGQLNYNLLKMVRAELLPSLRVLVQTTKKTNVSARKERLTFKIDNPERVVNLEVIPINPLAPLKERLFLIVFEDASSLLKFSMTGKTQLKKLLTFKNGRGQRLTKAPSKFYDQYIAQLQQELEATKEHQQSLAEDYDSAQEELTSANEELQSTNEELQSTNEELETAKEELQAANEELTTTNDELQTRNLELNEANLNLGRESAHVLLFEAVTVAANEANTVNEALQFFLDRICAHTGWSVGHAFSVMGSGKSEHGMMIYSECWCFDEPSKFTSLKKATEETQGESRSAYLKEFSSSQKGPLLFDIKQDLISKRIDSARAAGINTVFIFPVYVGASLAAVLEFFTTQHMKPDDRFLQVMSHMSPQLGRTIERKRAIEVEKGMQALKSAILSVALDCIITIDHDGKIQEFNPAAEKTFGYSRAEVIGKEMSDIIIPPSLRGDYLKGMARYLATGEGPILDRRIERSALRRDGTEFPVEISITRLPVEPPVFTGFLRDITETKKAQAILKRSQDELENLVTQRTAELKKKEDQLSEANVMLEQRVQERTGDLKEALVIRDNFLSIASHELKTPITTLKLNLQMIDKQLQSYDDKTLPPIQSFIKSVKSSDRQVDRLTRLIEDLLDVSKIQAGKLTISKEEIDFSAVVKEVLERFKSQLEEANCTVSTDFPEPVVIFLDRMRIEQVVINLLSNALKYAPGKPIHVSLSKESDWAVLVFRDAGPGIAKERQSKIFERFERATSSRNISGLGLGLYIVKEIIQAHQGTVSLESEAGQGTKFIVRLPLSPSHDLTLSAPRELTLKGSMK